MANTLFSFFSIFHYFTCSYCPLRGSALQKRLRDREKETELDERDRKREKEELEEIRQRLLAEGHPDPDAELQRVSPFKQKILSLTCESCFYLRDRLVLLFYLSFLVACLPFCVMMMMMLVQLLLKIADT